MGKLSAKAAHLGREIFLKKNKKRKKRKEKNYLVQFISHYGFCRQRKHETNNTKAVAKYFRQKAVNWKKQKSGASDWTE
jgi:uncharacterized protein Veg